MSLDRKHHLDSSFADDDSSLGGSAGKRTLTESLHQGNGAGSSAPTLASGPAPASPDPFDFSYTRPLAANDQAVEGEVAQHIDAGERNVNKITDQVFYRVRPDLADKKLLPNSNEAKEWLWIRDTFVAPAVKSAPEVHETHAAPKAQAPAAPAAPAAPPAPVAAPAPAPAPAQAHAQAHEAGHADASNIYRTQNDNLYMAGGTCNMTSLTMALLSFADGDEMRVKRGAGDALKRTKMKLGGIKINGKKEDMLHAIDTPELLAGIQIEDLLTTLANLKGLDVTNGGVILTIAKETGLVAKGKAGVTGYLKDAKTRTRAAEMLANGQQVILGVQGGPGHYVFLTQILDDGVVVHDPAGCRCQREAPFFLPTTTATTGWLTKMMHSLGTPGWTDAAKRRLSHNPAMLAVVESLLAARGLHGKDQTAAIKELAHGGALAMGESNFYSLADIKHYEMDIRVELQA